MILELITHSLFSFFFLVTEIVSHKKIVYWDNSFKNVVHGQKCLACISALFEMAQVKKSNFQATLPHCTPVLLRKTAPCPPNEPTRKRFGTTTYY
jgi:hypothetical protein